MIKQYQYMVAFTLHNRIEEELMKLLPYQASAVRRYFSQGKLLNYAFSVEKSKAWAIFSASSVKEVLQMVMEFPITKFTNYEISELSHYDVDSVKHDFSLN